MIAGHCLFYSTLPRREMYILGQDHILIVILPIFGASVSWYHIIPNKYAFREKKVQDVGYVVNDMNFYELVMWFG